MEQPTYRVAFLGAGGIAHHHAGYYTQHPRTTIVAACDIRPAPLAAFCDKFGVAARYADAAELLEKEKPDLVSICTWTATHPELVQLALQAGVKGILCEKPMSAHLGDARRAVAACAEKGVPLAVHHQRRFTPTIVAARQCILDGGIGTPVAAMVRTTGGFLNNGTHGVDLHRYLTGDPAPAWVMAQLDRTTSRYERGMLIEDRITAVVRFENGCELTVEVDMEAKPSGGSYVFGSEGTIKLERSQAILFGRGEPRPLPTEPSPPPLEELIRWMEGGPESRNAGRVALLAHEIMMASYESARTRSKVTIPLPPEVERSPLYTMFDEGQLPVTGERYDIRSVDALRYALQREGIPLTGREHLEGEGGWSGQGGPQGTATK